MYSLRIDAKGIQWRRGVPAPGRRMVVKCRRFDALVAAFNSAVIPEAQVMRGFQGGFWLGDRESGEVFGATLWDSSEALHATSAPAADLRKRVTEDIGSQVTNLHDLEVVARAETPG